MLFNGQLNKDTVNKYVNTFIESNKSLDELLKLKDQKKNI